VSEVKLRDDSNMMPCGSTHIGKEVDPYMAHKKNHAAMMEWIGVNMLIESNVTQDTTGSTVNFYPTQSDRDFVKDSEHMETVEESRINMVDKETTGCDTNVNRKLETCLLRQEIHTSIKT